MRSENLVANIQNMDDAEAYAALSTTLQRARYAHKSAKEYKEIIYQAMSDMDVDLDMQVPNAYVKLTVREAIEKYLDGGNHIFRPLMASVRLWKKVSV